MKRLFAMILLTLIAVSGAWANLGDSDVKIDYTYGDLVARHLRDDGTVSVLYHKDPYLYRVIFDNLRSIEESYSRRDGHGLSPKEIAKFLKANSAAGATWASRDTSKERKFERSDHKAEASYTSPNLTVWAVGIKSHTSHPE